MATATKRGEFIILTITELEAQVIRHNVGKAKPLGEPLEQAQKEITEALGEIGITAPGMEGMYTRVPLVDGTVWFFGAEEDGKIKYYKGDPDGTQR